MFCSQCGTESIPGQKYCSKCGQKIIINSTNQPVTTDDQNDKLQLTPLRLLGILGALLALLSFFFPWVSCQGYLNITAFDLASGKLPTGGDPTILMSIYPILAAFLLLSIVIGALLRKKIPKILVVFNILGSLGGVIGTLIWLIAFTIKIDDPKYFGLGGLIRTEYGLFVCIFGFLIVFVASVLDKEEPKTKKFLATNVTPNPFLNSQKPPDPIQHINLTNKNSSVTNSSETLVRPIQSQSNLSKARLLIVKGPNANTYIDIDKSVIIGRDPSCDIELSDYTKSISRKHIIINIENDNYILKDF